MDESDIYEEYLDLDFKGVTNGSQVSRRDFLKIAGATGAGLFLFFTFGPGGRLWGRVQPYSPR